MATSNDTTEDLPDTPQEVFKLLPAKARLVVFAVAALTGLTISAIVAGFASVNAPTPQWLTITLAVFPVITSGLGILAGSNIQKPTTTATAVQVPVTPQLAAAASETVPETTAAQAEASTSGQDTAAVTSTSTSAAYVAAPLPEATPTA